MRCIKKVLLAEDLKKLGWISRAYQWYEPAICLANTLIWENKVILITNPVLQILYASKNMVAMNGYTPKEVLGKRPTIFQGPQTQGIAKEQIRLALSNQQPFETNIINYRKDGRVYNCHIEGFPIFNIQGKLVNYIALEQLNH